MSNKLLLEWEDIQKTGFWKRLTDRWYIEQCRYAEQLGKGTKSSFDQLRYLQGRYAQSGEFIKIADSLAKSIKDELEGIEGANK
uniref:Uncharacterized protein n=1 Tax=viral metagenome TaxID=1070528 RepID=A0A6M3JRZ2_9ZZZZ